MAASFSLKSLGNKYYFCEMSRWFNLEAALQTSGVTESDVKEVIKKQFEDALESKDNEKIQITQMIELIRSMLT